MIKCIRENIDRVQRSSNEAEAEIVTTSTEHGSVLAWFVKLEENGQMMNFKTDNTIECSLISAIISLKIVGNCQY